MTAAQARPRRRGNDLKYTTFTILAEADALQIMGTWDPSTMHKSLMPQQGYILADGFKLVSKPTHAKGNTITLQGPQGE